jgi:hypothetical protein
VRKCGYYWKTTQTFTMFVLHIRWCSEQLFTADEARDGETSPASRGNYSTRMINHVGMNIGARDVLTSSQTLLMYLPIIYVPGQWLKHVDSGSVKTLGNFRERNLLENLLIYLSFTSPISVTELVEWLSIERIFIFGTDMCEYFPTDRFRSRKSPRSCWLVHSFVRI